MIASCFGVCAACSAPVVAPAPPTGEEIAFGGGSGGPADACFTCHGFRGEGDKGSPRLAGQSVGYLLKQMEDYARRWRDHPQMSGVALRLDGGERTAIALYYARLPRPGGAAPRAGDTPRIFLGGDPARALPACAECHGLRGEGRGLANPVLGGQPAEYVAVQLKAWKAARRRNDPQDLMGSVARKLTDAEIAALAAYVESLP